MFTKIFNDVSLLQKGLNASWTRNEVIANNVANLNTPGFKESNVEFESYFQEALNQESFVGLKSDPRHVDIGNSANDVQATVVKNDSTSMNKDGNNVDIDAQMIELSKNTLYYNMLTIKASKELGRLRMAINEGK